MDFCAGLPNEEKLASAGRYAAGFKGNIFRNAFKFTKRVQKQSNFNFGGYGHKTSG